MPRGENHRATPDLLREFVPKLKADGSDVVKIFASASIGDGGTQTMTDEQVQAVRGKVKPKTLLVAQKGVYFDPAWWC